MIEDSKSRCVLVTGGTRGLGLEISRTLVEDGYYVVGTGRTPSPELTALCDSYPDKIEYRQLDLAKSERFNQFIKEIGTECGPLYGLVNNAALAHDGVLATQHDSAIREQVRVNIEGTLLLTKYVVRHMLVHDGRRIVNVSSIAAQIGLRGLVAYSSTKGAIESMTRCLSRELGRVKITVNAVAPGYMETRMTESLGDDALETIVARSALETLPSVSDVADLVKYLLSNSASSITGAVIPVDSGRSI